MDYSPFSIDGPGIPDHSAHGQSYEAGVGAAFSSFSGTQNWERCSVLEVYPDRYTCDIYTECGRFLSGVPWPQSGGSVRAPKRLDRFALHFNLGVPVLHQAATDVQQFPDEEDVPPLQATAVQGVGGEDPVYTERGSGNNRGNLPKDIVAGDYIEVGDMGQMLGLMSGGTVMLKASDMAQIIATQARSMLKLVGQNVSLFTGAGHLNFTTEEGKTSMVLRVGADGETESDPGSENFRIRCELGDDGELVDFRVTDGKGRNLFRQHIDPDGRVETQATRRTDVVEEDRRVEVGAADRLTVGGDRVTDVQGSSVETVRGTKGIRAQGSFRAQAGGDAAMVAMHDLFLHAAHNMRVSATGDLVGTDPSLLFTLANGDVVFNVGSPQSGDTQVRQSGFIVDVASGAIRLGTVLGEVELNAGPGQTKIGGAPGVGPFSALLYEVFEGFMELFGGLIDSHVHVVPVIASTTLPPTIPPWYGSRYSLPPARSTFVKLGG